MLNELGRSVLQQEAKAILCLAESLGREFEIAVQMMLDCQGRVITCGVGKSGHIARKTAGTLSSTGTPSAFLHASEAVHGDLGMVTEKDVVVLYSQSGETDEIVRLFPSFRVAKAKTILVTGRRESTAARLADIVLDTEVKEEACPNNLAPTTSTTVMLALSDALALAAMDARGFTSADFAKLHPSGSLGKRLLLSVKDVMRPTAETAVVKPEAKVLDVTRSITQAGVGAACVLDPSGHLLGLISDGDIRRSLLNGLDLELAASEMMSSNVTTIEPTLLAIEALEFFQNLPRKLGELPVVDDGKLVGLLTLKDLLRSGIL